MPKTEEYKDKQGKNRIRHTADNGKVTYASTEGYENIQDMRNSAINQAIQLLEFYMEEMLLSDEQFDLVEKLGEEATFSKKIRKDIDNEGFVR